ncbi:MAG TPA: L,D-transpeptidase family protein [Xanthobacteraceae bacterium]
MSPGRMSAFVAGLGLLALIGIFLFSADRDFTGFRAADTAAVAQTPSATTQRIEDFIPTPQAADVPPLTLADLAREGGDKWIASQVPTPEPAGVAPITLKDVGPITASTLAPAQPATAAQPDAPLTGKDLVKAPLATTLASSETVVAEKLRDLLALRGERYFNRKNERAAAEQFYRDRGFVPLWVEKGAETARATAAFAYLRGIEADGLDPADYPMPNFKAIADADGLAEAELKFTAAIFDFARHAQTGRVHFSRITYDILYYPTAPEPAEVLARIAGARNMAEALDGYQPPHDAYKALKAKLADARGRAADVGPKPIPGGPLLKVDLKKPMRDARVALLRERLGVPGDDTYDKPLAEAVKKFQTQRKLSPTGNLNQATIDALNPPRRERDADVIIANMERWRWAPRDLGKVHVIVNIPDYTLKVVRDNQMVWNTRIVVGKPGNLATPITSAYMTHITVNPTWNVPPSIIQNEYLPALQQDPQAMDRIGLKLTRNPDGTIHIYQPPGDNNALGRIRFNFPNKFLVYQHDTPDKKLFTLDKRAFSHGCMRVLDPVKYAEVLLSIALPKEGYTQDRIRKMFGPGEVDIRLPSQIPVHLTYQSAFVDEAGKLQIREDVYGRDARLLAVLKSSERRVADIAVERRPATTINRDALRLPDDRFAGRGGNFFNWFLSR